MNTLLTYLIEPQQVFIATTTNLTLTISNPITSPALLFEGGRDPSSIEITIPVGQNDNDLTTADTFTASTSSGRPEKPARAAKHPRWESTRPASTKLLSMRPMRSDLAASRPEFGSMTVRFFTCEAGYFSTVSNAESKKTEPLLTSMATRSLRPHP